MKETRLGLVLALCFTLGCAKEGAVNLSDLSAVIPSIGFSSPTAQTSSASSSTSALQSFSLFRFMPNAFMPNALAATEELESFSEGKQAIEAVLDTTAKANCFSGLSFSAFSKQVNCYGPTIAYTNHPDGSGTGGFGCPAGASCLPSGDLGMWTATETSTGESCASAEMNALVGDVASTVNNGMKLMAGMVCLAQINGTAKPEVGVTIDLASDVNSNLAGASVTTASITRSADYTGTSNPVFTVSLVGTINGGNVSVTLKHSPAATGTDFKGRLYGTVAASTSATKGFSVIYNQTGSTVSYLAKSAQTLTSSGTSGLFDADGNYLYTTFLAGSGSNNANARYLLASVDAETGLGAIKFAWQAGGMDIKSRVFLAKTQENSGSPDTGFAYFGFGPNMSSASVGTIGGMCCNWAGPSGTCMGSASAYDTTSVQNQAIARNSSGIFTPITSAITYAPTTTCGYTGSTFKFGTITQWGVDGSSITAANVTHNLAVQTAVGTMPTITAPTF